MNSALQTLTTPAYSADSVASFARACGVPERISIAAAQTGTRDQLQNQQLPCEAVACVLCAVYGAASAAQQSALAETAAKALGSESLFELAFPFGEESTVFDALASQLAAVRGDDLSAEEEALVRGDAAVSGLAYYVCLRAGRSIKTADIAVAMNLESIRGELGAFDARLSNIARPFPGQKETASNVRHMVEGSLVITDEGRYAFGYDKKPRVQDAICVRATPQTHGGVRDIYHWAVAQVEKDADEACGGLYRTEYALDALATALADLAHISERRTFRLNETKLSYGLPMNLVPDELGINYGFPIVQSTQAAEVAELKLMTLPGTAIKSGEECLAFQAVSRVMRILLLLDRVMAVEILLSAQAMDIVHARIPAFPFGRGTTAVQHKVREYISMMDENRFVAPDMQLAERLLVDGELLASAEAALSALQ